MQEQLQQQLINAGATSQLHSTAHLVRRLAVAAGECIGEDLGAHAVDGAHEVAAGPGR